MARMEKIVKILVPLSDDGQLEAFISLRIGVCDYCTPGSTALLTKAELEGIKGLIEANATDEIVELARLCNDQESFEKWFSLFMWMQSKQNCIVLNTRCSPFMQF